MSAGLSMTLPASRLQRLSGNSSYVKNKVIYPVWGKIV